VNSLLEQLLPGVVVKQLPAVRVEDYRAATICILAIVDFPRLASELSAESTVAMLNNLQSALELLMGEFDVYQIDDVNDCYVMASGENSVINFKLLLS
jgi:class 3 adenylate cyclase